MQKNILLIVTNDQSYDTISCLGDNQAITPNIDELCESGLVFTNCHISGGVTDAVGEGSRASLHSGQDLFAIYDTNNTLKKELPLLGQVLRQEGYNTLFTGKWQNNIESFNRSFSDARNIFFGGMWDHFNVPLADYDDSGKYDFYQKYVVNFSASREVTQMRSNKVINNVHSTDIITDSALELLSKYKDDAPFFLNVSYLAPHDPRVEDKKYIDMYRDVETKLPDNFEPQHDFIFCDHETRDETMFKTPLDESVFIEEIRNYLAMITHIDDGVGKIVQELKTQGLYDNTIIVFTSDNGICLGSHGLVGKQNLYDKSIKVPLIVSGGIRHEPQVIESLIFQQDLFPTVIDLMNVEVDGVEKKFSFKKVLNGETECIREYLYLGLSDYIRGIKTQSYKLIKYRPKAGIEINQLYDLAHDPYEINNLYYESEFDSIKKRLELKLLEVSEVHENFDNPMTNSFWSKYE